MTTRTLKFNGMIVAAPATMTILIDGAEAFSGTVGADAELDTATVLKELTFDGSDSAWATKNVSITVNSGIAKVGTVPADCGPITGLSKALTELRTNLQDDNGYYNPGRHSSPYGETTERTNILINGSAPTVLDSQGFDPGPEGSEHWSGWMFEIAAGETITFGVRVPPHIEDGKLEINESGAVVS